MTVFKKYSAVYDLLYKDKDYEKEAQHIVEILQKYGVNPGSSILNLGCGTGRHDEYFSKKGFAVTGIDVSEEMLEIARKNVSGVEFIQSDIRDFELDKKYKAATALFHVMSYQTEDEDLLSVLDRVHKHLEKDGLFLFDCWNGDGVLKEKPENREKQIETEEYVVLRKAFPVMDELKNTVDVEYEFQIENKRTGNLEIFREKHKMRYYFLPEIKSFVKQTGFELVFANSDDWNLEILVRKV